MINITVKRHNEFVLLGFQLPNDPISPDILNSISPPDPITQNFAHLGVVISGRGPVWLYGFLVHYYHPVKWVATHDPRLQAAVVVASHTPEVKPGDVIKLDTQPIPNSPNSQT